jgi:hypothetical protein
MVELSCDPVPAFRETALRRKRSCCFRVLPRLVCWFCGWGLLCYSSAYSGQASVTGDVVSVKLSVQREWVLGSMPQAGRTIEKGVFYVRLGRPVSGIASAHRQYHLVQSGEGLHRQPCWLYEKMSGRARMRAQITKNNKTIKRGSP